MKKTFASLTAAFALAGAFSLMTPAERAEAAPATDEQLRAIETLTIDFIETFGPLAGPQEEQELRMQQYNFYHILIRATERAVTEPDMLAKGEEALERIRAGLEELARNPDDERSRADVAFEAIDEMVNSIDAHSDYMSLEEMLESQNRSMGGFAGLGIVIGKEGDYLQIQNVMQGGPAEENGILATDEIIAIDGQDTRDMSLEDAVGLMRGQIGTDVEVTIRREGEAQPLTLTITRNIIEQSPVIYRQIGDDIGFVRLNSFTGTAAKYVEEAIEQLQQDMGGNMRGLVFDLRSNGGGLVNEAIKIVDMFQEDGGIVSVGRGEPTDQNYTARPGDILNGLPLIVLTNGGSASASEIVSGALQDNGRATVLGTQTFGKGSVQEIGPLGQRGMPTGGLRLTTALYFTPSGDSIQGRGITPNVLFNDLWLQRQIAENPEIHLRTEADMEGAIANPETARDQTVSDRICTPQEDVDLANSPLEMWFREIGPTAAEDEDAFDYQMACAVEILRGTQEYTLTEPYTPAQDEQDNSPADDTATATPAPAQRQTSPAAPAPAP